MTFVRRNTRRISRPFFPESGRPSYVQYGDYSRQDGGHVKREFHCYKGYDQRMLVHALLDLRKALLATHLGDLDQGDRNLWFNFPVASGATHADEEFTHRVSHQGCDATVKHDIPQANTSLVASAVPVARCSLQ